MISKRKEEERREGGKRRMGEIVFSFFFVQRRPRNEKLGEKFQRVGPNRS
jgi:hypothetical protein